MKLKYSILFLALFNLACESDDEPQAKLSIKSINPSSGFCRDEVIITGNNFSESILENEITLNGKKADIIHASKDALTFVVPEFATTGKIIIKSNGLETSSEDDFQVLSLDPPKILQLSKNEGFPGDEITITGENFGDIADDITVKINQVEIVISENSPTSIKFIVPDAESGKILLTVKGQGFLTESKFNILVNLKEHLDQLVENNSSIPSIAFLAVQNGEIIFTHESGFYDDEGTKIPDQNTLYITSSLAKLNIAIAAMQQVEKGQIDLDLDVNQYLGFNLRNPNFPNTVITPRMLLQHSSSLRNPAVGEVVDDLFFGGTADSIIQFHPLIEDIVSPSSSIYKPTIWISNATPGLVNVNSNFGLVLMAYIIERISSLKFVEYAKQHIFEPLGMQSTSYHYPYIDPSNLADSYTSNNTQIQPASSFFYPTGWMYTSTLDWSRFMNAILNGGSLNGKTILTKESIDAMLNLTVPSNNFLAYNSNIGLVWREAPINQGWVGHTGAGFASHFSELNIENNIGYVILCNKGGNPTLIGPDSGLNTIIHKWLDQQLE